MSLIRRTRYTGYAVLAALLVVGLAACQPALPEPTPTATPPVNDATPDETGEDVEVVSVATVEPTEAPTTEPTEEPTDAPVEPSAELPPPPEMIGPESYPEGINPLTGLPVEDPSILARRPLVVKISNAPEVVRPQSGLSQADIIFEYYVEGGWTRFAAVFYGSGSNHIGPVRSARLPDIQLVPAFDGVLVFSGASRGVTDALKETDMYPLLMMTPHFGLGEPWFVRFPREGLAFEHTLYTNTDELWALAVERNLRATNIPTPGLAFHALPPSGGSPASVATLDYAKTSIRWQYDPVSGKYLRWTDGIVHTDALTGDQLAFDNVVVIGSTLELEYLYPEKYGEEEDSLYIELTGYNGPATYLRDGQVYQGRWFRQEGGMFQFVGPDGQVMPLKPGKTFVQIVRTGYEQVIVKP